MEGEYTILLVEDEAPAVLAIDGYLSHAGFTVIKCFSAQEGLKAALEHHPSLIILDIMMPAGSGLDMLPELRNDPWGKTAKVLIFSNLADTEYKATADKYYVDKCLVKTDTTLKELETSISQLVPVGVPSAQKR
jgi:DNA-binding response OmpR family regulator